MSFKNWSEQESEYAKHVDMANEETKKGGNVDAAMVHAVLALAVSVRLVAEAISELEA